MTNETLQEFSRSLDRPEPRGRQMGNLSRKAIALAAAYLTMVALIATAASGQSTPSTSWSAVNGNAGVDYELAVDGGSAYELRAERTETDTGPVSQGLRDVSVYAEGQTASSSTPLASTTVDVDATKHYLFAVRSGPEGAPEINAHALSLEATDRGTGRLTLVHAASAGQLTGTITDRSTEGRITNLSFAVSPGSTAAIGALPEDRYRLRITNSSGTVVYDENDLRVEIGIATEAVILGDLRTNDQDNVITMTRQVGEKLPPQVHIVNAFSGATQFDISVDDIVNRSGVEGLRRAGILQALEEGSHTIDIRQKETPGPPVASIEIDVVDGGDYDLVIYPNSSGGVEVDFFVNDLSPTRANTGRITVRHLAGIGRTGVIVQSSCENESVPDDIRRVILDPGGSYTFREMIPNDYQVDFVEPGTSSIVATGPDVETDAATHRFVYLMSVDPVRTPGSVKSYASALEITGDPVVYGTNGPAKCGAGASPTTTFPTNTPTTTAPTNGTTTTTTNGTTTTTSPASDERPIKLSPEFNTGPGRLYAAVFARQPDQAGFDYWQQQLANGLSLGDMAQLFTDSPEFTATYGNTTNARFVDLLYQNVLGREAENGGRSYWIGVLESGVARGDVVVQFSESAEFRRAVS